MNANRVKAIMLKFWYTNKRDIFRIFDVFFWPAIELLIWGIFSVFIAKTSTEGVNLVTVLLGGVILWSIFNRSSRDISLSMIDEMWSRNFVNLFSTPLHVGEYMLAAAMVGAIRLILSMLFMFFLAYTLYGFQISSLGYFLIPSAVGLTVFGWTLSIVVQSCFLRYGRMVEVFIWAVAALVQPFSCIFYPVSALPRWAQTIAWCLPTTYFFENMRQTMRGGGINGVQMGVAFGLNALYLGLAVVFLYRSFEKARRNGNLVKNY